MFRICAADGTPLTWSQQNGFYEAVFGNDSTETYLQLEFTPDFNFDGSEYVLLPACCYDGNRFDVLKKDYPPMFTEEEARVDMPVTITDVPRLQKDGAGIVEVTTGDVSVPCIGVYLRKQRKGILLYTIQQIDGTNLGLAYQQGKLMLRYPFFREHGAYRWPFMVKSTDKGRVFRKGETVRIPCRYMEFDCGSMEEFFEMFFRNRKCMGLPCERPAILPFQKQFEIQRDKFNYCNWYGQGGFYGHGAKTDRPKAVWQPGWCGGGMSSYALLKLGGELEQKRAMSTLRHIFHTQKDCGFLAEATDGAGQEISRGFGPEETKHWHLIRESADVLYFIFKHFDVLKERNIEIPDEFEAGAKRLADAFLKLWKRYGQFCQFVDLRTGDIIVGGSTAGAIAGAGLCRAYQYFGNEEYLRTAEAAGSFYYSRDAQNGYTTGGPGEILQGPDSESCAGLLETLVTLYETTHADHWLEKAKHAAHLCASWTVAYNYAFPPQSEFARLNIKSVGAVFANVQNKHGGPGICTLSGNSLYRLYQYTGEPLYRELFEDIVLTVSQYMSTDARPVFSWDVPKDASLLRDDSITAPRERLLPGYICERVNLSDWESARCVGGVFNGSCWCETTNLLILAESAPFVDESKIQWMDERSYFADIE